MRSLSSIAIPVAIAVAAATAATLAAPPRPSAHPTRWELEFKAGDLRLYVDEQTAEAYWFMTYEVTNRTGKEQTWAARFTLYTDAGEILTSGRGVPTRVTDDLLALLRNPLLETQNTLIGEIHHGAEHAKAGLIVWPAKRVEVNRLSLFVRGLSGESAAVVNPITAEEVILYKTLRRDYLIPGEAVPRGTDPLGLVGESWVMR